MKLRLAHPGLLMDTKVYLCLEPLTSELVADAARRAGHEVALIDLQAGGPPRHRLGRRRGLPPGSGPASAFPAQPGRVPTGSGPTPTPPALFHRRPQSVEALRSSCALACCVHLRSCRSGAERGRV